MGTVAPRARGRRPSVVNRTVVAALHAPLLRRLVEPGVCQLQYVGRRTGRIVSLPVMYAGAGHRIVVLSGRAAGKTWWRTFTLPHRLDVYRRGRWLHGTGCAVARGEPGWAVAAGEYRRRFPRVVVADADVFVVIAVDSLDGSPPGAATPL